MKLFFSLTILLLFHSAHAQTVLPNNISTNGPVVSLVRVGDTMYVAGSFTKIGEKDRTHLASINLLTGQVTDWSPTISPGINAIAIAGNRLYVGGPFSEINGQPRSALAAFDLTTGTLTDWHPLLDAPIRPIVSSIAADENTVYVAGSFSSVSGSSRNGLAAIDAATGGVTSWNPDPNADVRGLNIYGSRIYVYGNFTTIAGQQRNYIVAFDRASGALNSWDPALDGSVIRILPYFDRIYLGGFFNHIGSATRPKLSIVDTLTGAPGTWNPGTDSYPIPLAIEGNTIYVGGFLTNNGGATRTNLAALELITRMATPFMADADNQVRTAVVVANQLYVGGDFTQIAGQLRPYLAVLELPSDAPLPVRLLSFTAQPNKYSNGWKVDLAWATGEEFNSSHFLVERSANGGNFNAIGQVNASGQSASRRSYKYQDALPLSGTSYYRLKQVDHDGKFFFSAIVSTSINGAESFFLYPVPAQDRLTILISSTKKKKLGYIIVDASGKTAKKGDLQLTEGSNRLDLTVDGLPAGIYHLVLQERGKTKSVEFVKN